MSIETLITSESTSNIGRLGTLLDSVRTSVARGLDWFVPKYTPVPPDTFNFEETIRGPFFTQADHDRLYESLKDFKFSEK